MSFNNARGTSTEEYKVLTVALPFLFLSSVPSYTVEYIRQKVVGSFP